MWHANVVINGEGLQRYSKPDQIIRQRNGAVKHYKKDNFQKKLTFELG